MKIPASIRNLYNSQRPLFERLERNVTLKIKGRIPDNWHYDKRIKTLDSYSLKLESGRFHYPEKLEDFFACTIVVPNKAAVGRAERLIRGLFQLKERRPKSNTMTTKYAHSFPFDDLRLYVQWQDDPAVRSTILDGTLFEVQIKTYLQHAWAIATHDLVYKTDSVSWPKERIAFQIKAMLEHAELSIHEALALSGSRLLPKTDARSTERLALVQFLKRTWKKDDLPKDLCKVAQNIADLLHAAKISRKQMLRAVRWETNHGRGSKIRNLSPYLSILQTLLVREEKLMSRFLSRPAQKFRLLLPEEVSIPSAITPLLANTTAPAIKIPTA